MFLQSHLMLTLHVVRFLSISFTITSLPLVTLVNIVSVKILRQAKSHHSVKHKLKQGELNINKKEQCFKESGENEPGHAPLATLVLFYQRLQVHMDPHVTSLAPRQSIRTKQLYRLSSFTR
jgi:hypothetical protein